MQWELITNISLIASLITLGLFVIMGLYQWITRKSIKKVDKWLLWMPLPLALMVITYFIFEIFPVNFRPDGSGESSFPSTHVMVVATIFFLALMNLPKYVKSKPLEIILEIIMIALIGVTCTGRVLANMHWITDVIGGLAFAFIFTEIYYYCIKHKKSKK